MVFMSNNLPVEKKIAVLGALVEGCSIRSTERLTNVHRDTITRLLVRVGEGCASILDEKMRDLYCVRLELDEIWAFVGKKQRRVSAEDDARRVGDQWTYIAIDADTKLIPSFLVGKRTAENTNEFVCDVAARLSRRVQLSTDGLKMYVDAIGAAFGSDKVDYAQVVKTYEADAIGPGRYSPPEVASTEKTPIFGEPIAEYRLDELRRALEPQHAHGHAAFHAAHERVLEETGEPLRRRRAVPGALQLRPHAPHDPHAARARRGRRDPPVGARRAA